MPKVKRDEIRENRLMMEVVVDAYGAEEIAGELAEVPQNLMAF